MTNPLAQRLIEALEEYWPEGSIHFIKRECGVCFMRAERCHHQITDTFPPLLIATAAACAAMYFWNRIGDSDRTQEEAFDVFDSIYRAATEEATK